MKKHYLLLLPLILLIQACPKKVAFTKKEFIIKNSDPVQKITLDVPESCENFNTGVKVNIDAMVKYAGQEASLQANFEKISLISEFSDRLRAITAAQCRIVQTSTVIDPSTSDQTFYNDIVKNYTEYQKVRDLIASSPTEGQKDEITKTILSVYETMYANKKDELINYIENLEVEIEVEMGAQVAIYVNDERIGGLSGGLESPLKYVIDKKYLLPKPDETINIRFVASVTGYKDVQKEFTLAKLQLEKQDKGKATIVLIGEYD
ncbi:hypothetical protein [Leptobacterium sp. I13]|uniref:hypothetical protein n=1 Tax=Leptobacterium meishanense TaxID=3128904 RepID=UPI0030EB9884